jgi:protein-S-isoprenylcysteine O-methyltransferase Ste14
MKSSSTPSDSPQVVVLPPVLFAATLAAGLLLHWWRPMHPLPSFPARVIGACLVFGAATLLVWGRRVMTAAGTNVRPTQPTTAIVTHGPFRFTRNPLYVGLTGVYLGITLLVNATWPLLLLVPCLIVLQWGVVAREERYLAKKFGEPYLAYKKHVRRWF